MSSLKPDNAPEFWRTLAEKDGANLGELVGDEFASRLPGTFDQVERRAFLKLMGASLALAGMAGCTRQPPEQILPYVRQPETIIPGKPLSYATAMTLGGRATGILVESHEGRPTKIEGNPSHPASLGATDVFAQAALLDLYDPDRMQTLSHVGEILPWSAFIGAMRTVMTSQHATKGAGLRILTETVCSPTLAAQIEDVLARFPAAVWHQWDPGSELNAAAGLRLAAGTDLSAHYNVENAAVIVCLDADFFSCGAGSLRYARQFARRRRPEGAGCRLYAAETTPTPTGAKADHRLPLKPSQVESLARALAVDLGVAGVGRGTALSADAQAWLTAVRADLAAHRGSSLVVAGEAQPAVVHALAHAMNAALGNAGRTVLYTDPIDARPVDHIQSIRDLAAAMAAGHVDTLLIIGGNPVYTAPADLRFAEQMSNVRLRAHLSLHANETSAISHWQIPEAHFLEAWSDARAFDGTVSIVQPLIAPLYGGRSAHEVLAALSDRPERTSYQIVREHWQDGGSTRQDPPYTPRPGVPPNVSRPGLARETRREVDPAFEAFWRRTVHDGVMANTTLPTRAIGPIGAIAAFSASPATPPGGIEIAFRNDPTVHDGRFNNNGWLQELPKPLTHLTWDNAVLVSPATMTRLNGTATPDFTGGERGQIHGSVVEIRYRGRAVRGAMFPVAGHPDDVATLHLGYGRTRTGHVGRDRGFNAGALRTSDALGFGTGAQIALTGDTFPLACVQYHHLMEGRDIIRAVPRAELAALKKEETEFPSIWPVLTDEQEKVADYKWGMSIDLNACNGCSACVVSCQAENNIPVVGKTEVMRGREMHWLRVDSYHQGEIENPKSYFQPVPCMHCETAPCEPVCPVGATVHSSEGLNDMVYNRCVGTRYCSNNCPYKVRRFNFLQYQDWNTPSLMLGRNPDVTVRSRGVMEKCTYCVQRISAGRIQSEREGRTIQDGEVKTACQAVCPTEAIVFGNLNDPNSRVSKLQAEQRDYALLRELNTRPRTTYLAAITEMNPDLATKNGHKP
ncbi:MAG TPA: 4Fe-4S dicluster domain-containing protein [Vicinamibacterales bacterium]|nr:4Fe-4S dicluster domain-containing protein [Vicinamibacterales bacterium]